MRSRSRSASAVTRPVIDDIREAGAEAPAATLGHNNPPTPFDEASDKVDSLFEEAGHWLDGAEVGEAEAEKIAELIRSLEACGRQLEKMRITEKKPWDDGAKEVQARYKPVAAKVDLAISTARKAVTPFLAAREREQQAEATRLRVEAENAVKAAQEALRSTNAGDEADLAKRQQAEALVDHAKDMERIAKKAEAVKSQIKNEGGRAIGLKTVYTAIVSDPNAFAKYLWMTSPGSYSDFLQAQAQRYVTLGRRDIPGITVTEEKIPV